MAGRDLTCRPHTSSHRSGLRGFAYSWLPFVGLYTEDGQVLRGTQGQAKSAHTPIPAKATATPKNCCGQLRNP